MTILKKNGYYYIRHSLRKDERVITREKYLGKEVPENIEEIKSAFLMECIKEDLFRKLSAVKKNFGREWKTYPESVKKKVLIDFLIKFTYNSNAIEGSTITLEETEDIIKRKLAPHKSIKDIQETINHSKAFFQAINEKKISSETLLAWHNEIFYDSKPDIAGTWRTYLVRVGEYRAPNWQEIKKLIKNLFVWYEKNVKMMHPVELAARAHYRFEKIHPFGDGNGRIGRLIIAHILKKNSYPIIVIEYSGRKQYYNALSKNEDEFVKYFMKRYLKEYKEYLK
ncbi:MAG: Fic family protein [Nanoarchaeota archaeon]|nr:Fic family protein [Nanoarchaeota archaeon]